MSDSVSDPVLERLARAVVAMDESAVRDAAHEAVDSGVDAYEAVDGGLSVGMQRVGELYERHEYFIPELLLCADAMYAGLDVLRPHVRTERSETPLTVVIGVVKGDTHDIGKNLVTCMFEAAGFHVHDLGRNVAPARFVEVAGEVGAHMIALSTLMSSTMGAMEEVVTLLEEQGVRDDVRVMVGGAPVSAGFAQRIGADGYAPNAAAAVEVARGVVGALA